MLSLRKPSAEAIQIFLATQSKLDFTYAAVGATATVSAAQIRGGSHPASISARERLSSPPRRRWADGSIFTWAGWKHGRQICPIRGTGRLAVMAHSAGL